MMTAQMAFRNFTRNGRRFFLLGLAVCAGFFFVCCIQSLVAGLSYQINERGSRYYGGHVVIGLGSELRDGAGISAEDRFISDAITRSGVRPAAISIEPTWGPACFPPPRGARFSMGSRSKCGG